VRCGFARIGRRVVHHPGEVLGRGSRRRYGRCCMVTKGPGESLLGRRRERELLDRLLADARGGRSGVLVVRGEPGVGKTALLEYAASSASGFRIIRTVGIESEMELAFAALQQVCAPVMDEIERLPDPQQAALRVALGLSSGDPPDRFLVGLAVLSLLSAMAEERPLLCVVDDAQWLDRASTDALAFVARRVLAEPLAFVYASRRPAGSFSGLPELVVEGLPEEHARVLLDSVIGWPLDERVRDRIVAETRGNPLALLELPRGLTAGELAGGFGLPQARALPSRIEESFRRRIEGLPVETQRLLLVAAADPVGDPLLLWHAADGLGIGASAADAAETEGLLEVGAVVTFRHPLVRSAVYRAAMPDERRAVHRALAEATDPEVDPDRRVWHLAQAAVGFDEDIASELERSAGRAQARGGLAAAAAFVEKAAALTPDPKCRAERALAAAQAKLRAGALESALALAATAEAGPLGELERAQLEVVRAQISFESNRGSEAPPLLLNAAERLEPLDPRLAREIHLHALSAAMYAGRLAGAVGYEEVARAARGAPPATHPPRASDLLLDGLAQLVTDGHAAGAPTLRRALSALRAGDLSPEECLPWGAVGCVASGLMWDYESWDAISAHLVRCARDAGALSALPLGLINRAGVHVLAGEVSAAASVADEATNLTQATGSSIAPYAALAAAAFEGNAAEATELLEVSKAEVIHRGEGSGLSLVHWATAVLHNGLGRYPDALAAAQQADEETSASWWSNWALVEVIEAGARSEATEAAADALGRLSEITTASGTDWALGIESRARALMADGDAAEKLYRQSIAALERTRVRAELARSRLLYGEWLRRERRRLDAREQLRSAHELFNEFGMEAFAERARIELQATGEHARKRRPETRDDLTPQEAQISRLAAEGATNPEIAAQLFISPRTVNYHLRKVFRKLGVKSRHQLEQYLLQPGAHADISARGN
jgi:DNA-binding CsgD family transcriptional regulator